MKTHKTQCYACKQWFPEYELIYAFKGKPICDVCKEEQVR